MHNIDRLLQLETNDSNLDNAVEISLPMRFYLYLQLDYHQSQLNRRTRKNWSQMANVVSKIDR